MHTLLLCSSKNSLLALYLFKFFKESLLHLWSTHQLEQIYWIQIKSEIYWIHSLFLPYGVEVMLANQITEQLKFQMVFSFLILDCYLYNYISINIYIKNSTIYQLINMHIHLKQFSWKLSHSIWNTFLP